MDCDTRGGDCPMSDWLCVGWVGLCYEQISNHARGQNIPCSEDESQEAPWLLQESAAD
jgi:hypothetical protein